MTYEPVYKAALIGYVMSFDKAAGAWTPTVPADIGIVHGVRPVHTELNLREPYFIEDRGDYRAALCGVLVRVIMPNTFKTNEPDGCWACISEALDPSTDHRPILRPAGRPGLYGGDAWSPKRLLHKSAVRIK